MDRISFTFQKQKLAGDWWTGTFETWQGHIKSASICMACSDGVPGVGLTTSFSKTCFGVQLPNIVLYPGEQEPFCTPFFGTFDRRDFNMCNSSVEPTTPSPTSLIAVVRTLPK